MVFFLSVRLYRNNIHNCKDIILQSMILLNRKITRTFLTPSKRLLAPCIILVVTKKKTSTFDIETHPLLIVILYRYTWNTVLIWFQTLTSVLKTAITAATQLLLAPIPMDHSSAFVNLDSVVMDTTAQVLNTTDLEHDNLSHHRNKPRRLVEVESLYKLPCYY